MASNTKKTGKAKQRRDIQRAQAVAEGKWRKRTEEALAARDAAILSNSEGARLRAEAELMVEAYRKWRGEVMALATDVDKGVEDVRKAVYVVNQSMQRLDQNRSDLRELAANPPTMPTFTFEGLEHVKQLGQLAADRLEAVADRDRALGAVAKSAQLITEARVMVDLFTRKHPDLVKQARREINKSALDGLLEDFPKEVTEQRNNTLRDFAESLRGAGLDEGKILATVHVANEQRCKPPLPKDEVVGICTKKADKAEEPEA